MRHEIGKGWAWRIEIGLCHYALSSRDCLDSDGKPSPEAVKVHVAIVPMALWRKLTKKPRKKTRR